MVQCAAASPAQPVHAFQTQGRTAGATRQDVALAWKAIGTTALFAVCILCMFGCGAGPEAPGALREARELSVTEEFRIDALDADLVPVDAITVADDGTLAVVQNMDHAIRFFDSNGEPVTTVGRAGRGPGEFARIARMGWLADTLWVLDAMLQRMTLVAPDLTVTRTFNLKPDREISGGPEAIMPLMPFAVYPNGEFIAVNLTHPTNAPVVRTRFQGEAWQEIGVAMEHQENFGQVTIGDRGYAQARDPGDLPAGRAGTHRDHRPWHDGAPVHEALHPAQHAEPQATPEHPADEAARSVSLTTAT